MVDRKSTTIVLDAEAVAIVHRMLLVGLTAYGEIERLEDEQELAKQLGGHHPLPERLAVLHPTGSHETTGDFASALMALNCAGTFESECRIVRELEADEQACRAAQAQPGERFTL